LGKPGAPGGSVVLCCTVLHCVALYCTVLHCVALCCTVLQCVAQYCTVLQCCSSAVKCSAVQCSAVQCRGAPSSGGERPLAIAPGCRCRWPGASAVQCSECSAVHYITQTVFLRQGSVECRARGSVECRARGSGRPPPLIMPLAGARPAPDEL
jgi:hypothetical protein